MSPVRQFLASLVGAVVGIALAVIFSERRPRHWIRLCFIAVAVACTLPLYTYSLAKWEYGLWFLPVLGGVLGGMGFWLGSLVAQWLERRHGSH